MSSQFPSAVLSVAADVVSELEGEDALYGLWNLFTKCKESLKDGRRLENISWRLWYRKMAASGHSPSSSPGSLSPPYFEKDGRSSSPITPMSEDGSTDDGHLTRCTDTLLALPDHLASQAHSWHGATPTPAYINSNRRLSTASMPFERSGTTRVAPPSFAVGRLIIDILPGNLDSALLTGPSPVSKSKHPNHRVANNVARTPALQIAQPRPLPPSLPTMQLPSSSPNAPGHFPRVVVVNPTPHPTPPATPSLPGEGVAIPVPALAQAPLQLLPPPSAATRAKIAAPTLTPQEQPAPALGALAVGSTQSKQLSVHAAEVSVHTNVSPSHTHTLPTPSSPHGDDASLPAERTKRTPSSKHENPHTRHLRSSDHDQPFFLPSDYAPAQTSPKSAADHAASTVLSASVSSEGLSQIQSPLSEGGSRRGGASGSSRGRRKEIGRNAHAHAPTRPTLRRTHTGPQRQAAQKKAAGEQAPTKKTAFNVDSSSSTGSGSKDSSSKKGDLVSPPVGASSKTIGAQQQKQKQVAAPAQAAPAPLPQTNQATRHNASTSANPPKRGIVVSSSSEHETTMDSDDDSEWASEDVSIEEPDRERQEQETRLREAAEEAQRQRDMFEKVPKRSYSNLNRTRSGLLSQLLNPDPNIFPPNHPYRLSQSTQDMTQFARGGHGAAFGASGLTMTRSSAAVPLTAQVTAQVPPMSGLAATRPPNATSSNLNGGYQKRGRPQAADLEDFSESEAESPDNTIQLSHSLAQQKLAALADPSRRRNPQRTERAPSAPTLAPPHSASQQAMRPLTTVATAPIPLGHPYNLPAPAPPSTPRTTRRQMLATELSESFRRNLLWERQVSRINMTGGARRGGVLGGLRPMTAANPEAGAGGSRNDGRTSGGGTGEGAQEESRDEKRRKALARNRSWADDYHHSGW